MSHKHATRAEERICEAQQEDLANRGTEMALEQAQELLRTIMSPHVRETVAIRDLTVALDAFLAAYGVDGESDLSDFESEQDESLCTCANRSWYGEEHDTACELKGKR